MLNAKLRHRIDIEQLIEEVDSNGIHSTSFVTIRDSNYPDLIPAEIVPLSGREFIAAQSLQAGITTRISVRWHDGIKASMRVNHNGEIYNIKAVLPDPTLRRYLTLMCETGVNNG